jgi:hypothetical protein
VELKADIPQERDKPAPTGSPGAAEDREQAEEVDPNDSGF